MLAVFYLIDMNHFCVKCMINRFHRCYYFLNQKHIKKGIEIHEFKQLNI
jgi:hypothetical protein